MPFPYPFPAPLPSYSADPIENLGFETGDVAAGDAEHWTKDEVNTGEREAIFAAGLAFEYPAENFEGGWASNESYLFELVPITDATPALFDTTVSPGEGVEDFEEGWSSNQFYAFELGSASPAMFRTGLDDHDGFEAGWGAYDFTLGATAPTLGDPVLLAANATPGNMELRPVTIAGFPVSGTYELVLDNGVTTEVVTATGTSTSPYPRVILSTPVVGTYLAGPSSVARQGAEDFEAAWRSNEFYQFEMGSTSTANFLDGSLGAEDFEDVKFDQAVSVDASTDVFTATAHGLVNGEAVYFRNEGGALPLGIAEGFKYFVRDKTTDTFKIAATSGGAAVDVVDAGHGLSFVRVDPVNFWRENLDA